jgi:hypothetical protein
MVSHKSLKKLPDFQKKNTKGYEPEKKKKYESRVVLNKSKIQNFFFFCHKPKSLLEKPRELKTRTFFDECSKVQQIIASAWATRLLR